ncbi:hypothetical protein GCM10012283_07490 [Phycicoccus endophyticus]|nr:hypothetical protein GCM10012283_07490 [Phycicoccus endophyticus]
MLRSLRLEPRLDSRGEPQRASGAGREVRRRQDTRVTPADHSRRRHPERPSDRRNPKDTLGKPRPRHSERAVRSGRSPYDPDLHSSLVSDRCEGSSGVAGRDPRLDDLPSRVGATLRRGSTDELVAHTFVTRDLHNRPAPPARLYPSAGPFRQRVIGKLRAPDVP